MLILNRLGKFTYKMLIKKPIRSDTRSSKHTRLTDPRIKLITMGGRSFQKAAPTLWNGLPHHIQDANTISTFKSALKTHLFQQAYF